MNYYIFKLGPLYHAEYNQNKSEVLGGCFNVLLGVVNSRIAFRITGDMAQNKRVREIFNGTQSQTNPDNEMQNVETNKLKNKQFSRLT